MPLRHLIVLITTIRQ